MTSECAKERVVVLRNQDDQAAAEGTTKSLIASQNSHTRITLEGATKYPSLSRTDLSQRLMRLP